MGQVTANSARNYYVLGEVFDEEIGNKDLIAMTGAEYKEILAIFKRQSDEIEALEYRVKTLLEP